tara:strand:+ start:977 stop:1156 length:180 start_codon:yes stop_codon:yes gene_type:complete
MQNEVLQKLLSQKLEIVELITINAIALRSQPDNGQLNNLQRCLKLNEEIIKIVKTLYNE